MLFNSYEFIFLFVPVLLLGFYVLGRWGSGRAALGLITLGSLFYYGSWKVDGEWRPDFILLLGTSICVNYLLGRKLSRQPGKVWLWVGIVFNLGLIGYYKYGNFVVDQLPEDWAVVQEWQPVLLPLAISFFTFQQIAYLVDAWQGKCKEYRFLDYCLFVSFFPQLIAGPIVHHQEMMPQFHTHRYRIRPEWFAKGLTWFVLGLFKKVILADGVAQYSTPVFEAALGGSDQGLLTAWVGVLAYTAQIYFDFSGYSDMAVGLGYLFGVELPINFNSPYKARSITEFWHRWHMTLSRFLRDYLYIPLGGNRKGESRRYVNLMLTMLLGGLWHGAAWTFVLWGGLHGLFLMIEHGASLLRKGDRRAAGNGSVLGGLVTFLAVVFAWVPFRSESFEASIRLYRGMLGFEGLGNFRLEGGMWVVLCLGIAFVLPNTQELFGRSEMQTGGIQIRWKLTPAWAVFSAMVAIWTLLHMSEVSEFLYFQF